MNSGALMSGYSDRTVLYYLKQYVKSREAKKSSKNQYLLKLNVLSKTTFVNRPVSQIRVADAKRFLIELKIERDVTYSTISGYGRMLKGAFTIALEDEVVLRNPFAIDMSFLHDDGEAKRKKAIALTRQQQSEFMSFIWNSAKCRKYYNEIMIMLGTGMRIGELCGLTEEEIDFANDRIEIKHQLALDSWELVSPKTENSYRFIPMSNVVRSCLIDAIENRTEKKIVGFYKQNRFLFSTNTGHPYSRCVVLQHLKRCIDKYNETYPDKLLPEFTPHSLRHTFCTNMVEAGALPKDLQYIMGHSRLEMTMDYYTHYQWDLIDSKTKQAVNR